MPGHWILAIIIPTQSRIYIVDSNRGYHNDVAQLLMRWYTYLVLSKRGTQEQADTSLWRTIQAQHLPKDLPRQYDGTSCGVFTSITAYYWLQHRRLPNLRDFSDDNIIRLTDEHICILRLFMATIIQQTNALIHFNASTTHQHRDIQREHQYTFMTQQTIDTISNIVNTII